MAGVEKASSGGDPSRAAALQGFIVRSVNPKLTYYNRPLVLAVSAIERLL